MKILPCQSAGIVLMHEDGETFEMAPLQVFRRQDGWTVIRLGRNCLFFDANGRFDGEEMKTSVDANDAAFFEEITAALNRSGYNHGRPPADFHFDEGTNGRLAEEPSRVPLPPAERPS